MFGAACSILLTPPVVVRPHDTRSKLCNLSLLLIISDREDFAIWGLQLLLPILDPVAELLEQDHALAVRVHLLENPCASRLTRRDAQADERTPLELCPCRVPLRLANP